MRRLKEKFPNELVIIGVHSGKFPSEQITENIRQAVQRHGILHPVVNDAGMKIWNAYAVRAWPTLILIDPRGRIAGEVSGEILADEFAQNITEIIEQNPDAIDRRPLDLRAGLPPEPVRPLRYPSRLLIAGDSLFIADSGHHRVIEVAMDADGLGGSVRRVFGSGQAGLKDGAANQARFNHPHGLGLTGSAQTGRLFVADTENHAVRAIDLASGIVTTLAGNGQKAHGRLDLNAAAVDVPLRSPWAVLPLENYLLIAMAGSHQVWVLKDDGQIGPFAGNGREALVDGPIAESSFNQPSDLALGMGHLFIADPEASAVRAISLGEQPRTVTLVGQGLFDFGDQDGPTNTALLQHPTGVDFADRLVYIADTYNNKIKVLDPFAGQVHTFIGSGKSGWQDGPFESARLFEPEGVLIHAQPDAAGSQPPADSHSDPAQRTGKLYIADTNNHLIRVADLGLREVFTFRLRGVDLLNILPSDDDGGVGVERLAAVHVRPGRLSIRLEVALPAGYARNPEAPTLVYVTMDGNRQEYRFDAHEAMQWTIDLGISRDLLLEIQVLYCRHGEAGLCLMDVRKIVLPLQVEASGLAEAVVAYALPAAVDGS